MQSSLIVPEEDSWTHLGEFGSLRALLRLVAILQAKDKDLPPVAAAPEQQLRPYHDQMFAASYSYAGVCAELLGMHRIAQRYAELQAPSSTYNVVPLLNETINRCECYSLASQAINLAENLQTNTGLTRGMRRRIREIAGYPDDIVVENVWNASQAGTNPIDAYRQGIKLRRSHPNEAEQMFELALEAEQKFGLALREYAALRRRYDPAGASTRYAMAAQYLTSLNFLSVLTAANDSNVPPIEYYRNFALVMRRTEYLAYPVATGTFDLTSAHLSSFRRRLMGLFLLRLRFYGKKNALLAGSEMVPLRKSQLSRLPQWWPPLWRLASALDVPFTRRFIAPIVTPSVRPLRLLERAGKRLVTALKWYVPADLARIIREPTSISLIAKRRLARRMIRWVGLRLHLFQFVLNDSSPDDLKRQIDLIYDSWLSTRSRARQ